MYVAIICSQCHGKSQVAEALLGQPVQCPLCGKATTPRTPEPLLPVATPLQEEPLSLDDAEPQPVRTITPQKKQRRSPLMTALWSIVSLVLTLALMAGVYAAFHYGDGDIGERSWATFAPEGSQCSIRLPGEPTVEDITPEGFASQDGKRLRVVRWFEKVVVEFGWVDFDASRAGERRFDELVNAVRDRESKRMGGKLVGENSVVYAANNRKFEVRQFQLDVPDGKALLQIYFDADPKRLKYHEKVETEMVTVSFDLPTGWNLSGPPLNVEIPVEYRRMVIEPGQSVRLYFAAVRGKKISKDTSWVPKFFNSFEPR